MSKSLRQSKRIQTYCPNTNMLYEVKRRLLLGRSTVCSGHGVFAGESFQKGDFVGEYLGEILNERQSEVFTKIQILF
jgi:hypothetical protein